MGELPIDIERAPYQISLQYRESYDLRLWWFNHQQLSFTIRAGSSLHSITIQLPELYEEVEGDMLCFVSGWGLDQLIYINRSIKNMYHFHRIRVDLNVKQFRPPFFTFKENFMH